MRYAAIFVGGCALAVLAAIIFAGRSSAFLPGNCRADHALNDYDASDAVVVGRVVAVERVMEKLHYASGREVYHFAFYATIRVGRAIRGLLRVDDEFRMLVGGYTQMYYDDTEPTGRLMTSNTHPPHDLPPGGVRLLFVNRVRNLRRGNGNPNGLDVTLDERAREIVAEDNVWEPRSCHFSVHRIVWGDDGDGGRTLWVRPSVGPSTDAEPGVQLLEDFLSRKREESCAIRRDARARRRSRA